MKAKIHPTWYNDAEVTCACGNTFKVGAALPKITVDICSNCHPFYTGQMKFADRAGRVDAFRAKLAGANKKVLSKSDRMKAKRDKRLQDEAARPESLAELRNTQN